MCSWSCFEHEAFKIFGSISVQSLAQARSQHEPLGFGLVTLQGIVEAPLVSYCSSFPSNQDHRPENSKCLVALSLRPIWILLLHIYLWPCAESFSTCLSISSGQVDSGLAVTVFFLWQSSLHTASVLLVDVLLGNSTLVTPIQVLDSLHQLEQWSSMVATWSTTMLVSVYLCTST